VPMGCPEAILSMADAVAGRDGAAWMVGERHAAEALGGALSEEAPVLQRRQLLMSLESVRPGPSITIRQALLGDLEWVVEAVRSVNQEDLGVELFDLGGPTLVRKVEASIVSGVEWLGAGRSYRAKVGTLGQYGAQLGGVWVPPAHRGRGLGQMGTRALCERLLGEVPVITLHVDAENLRALRCYEAVGFRAIRDFQLWVR
jgi:GNAT superfamily N-acetyltransferase